MSFPEPRRSPRRVRAHLPRPVRLLLVAIALVAGASTQAAAQEGSRLAPGDTIWEVRLAAGETYIGRVVGISGDSVTLETTTGTRIQFTRAQAVRVRPAEGTVQGDAFWRKDPNDTRLFFSPTARTLSKGNGYLGVYELFIPFVAYGVTDRILIAGGSPFYLALTGEITPPIYLGPKVLVVSTPSFSASLGALGVLMPDGENTETFGIAYGVSTWGSSDHALTAGIGWGYIDDALSDKPVVLLGGETRVGRYTKLLTENMYVPGESGVIASGGVRFFGERLSADAGLVGFFSDNVECCFPLVNFVYNFGGER